MGDTGLSLAASNDAKSTAKASESFGDVDYVYRKFREELEALKEKQEVEAKRGDSKPDLQINMDRESKTEMEELKRELEKSNQRVKELKLFMSNYVSNTKDINIKWDPSEWEPKKLRDSLEQMKKENAELEKRHEDDKQTIRNLAAQVEVRVKEKKEKKQLDYELAVNKKKATSLQREVFSLQRALVECQLNPETRQEENMKDEVIADLKTANSNLKRKHEILEQELVKVQETQEVFEKEYRELQKDFFQTQKSLADIQINYKLLQDGKTKMNYEFQSLFKKNSELETSFHVLEQERNEKGYAIMRLKERLKRSEVELEVANKNNTILEIQNSENAEDMLAIQHQISAYQTTCHELRQDISCKETELECLNDKISALNTDLSYAKATYTTNEEEKARLALKLITSEEEYVQMLSSCNAIKKEKEKLESDLSSAEKKIGNYKESDCKKYREREDEFEAKLLKEESIVARQDSEAMDRKKTRLETTGHVGCLRFVDWLIRKYSTSAWRNQSGKS